MINAKSMDILGRLFYLQSCSLPRYVVSASPYIAPGDEHLFERLQAIAAGQECMAQRLADAIWARHGRLPLASFPTRFSSLHDLELRRLITLVVQEQHAVVKEIEAAVKALADDADFHRLAYEMWRVETAQLTLLEEIVSDRPIELASSSLRGNPEGKLGAPRRILVQKSPFVTTAA